MMIRDNTLQYKCQKLPSDWSRFGRSCGRIRWETNPQVRADNRCYYMLNKQNNIIIIKDV